jgi:N-methylhydantoinase A/oxoprolinase/acetone carboxylase beta subunit
MSSRYGLGIDAGGTYTDAVILDLDKGRVVHYVKALTTRPDPSEGIRSALSKIPEKLLDGVSMVSLATTFATNAIVEDRGVGAGLILIGYEQKPEEIPGSTRVLMLEGGHTVSGDEKAPLDLGYLNENLPSFLRDLEAVAVTGFFSVRNPDHELKVSQFIRKQHDVSVVLGHQLSMRLDAMKRATTAWWNARLIPLVRRVMKSTENVLLERDISVPLMIVRGDGTLMSVRTALDRPIDTLLSGPAASILGAKFLSNVENALIIDMGGTTTDMALLLGGRVAINPQGAQVGKWKTHVEAAKVRTMGLGGDSLISIEDGRRVTVGPRRVLPLCQLAVQEPRIIELLKVILQKVSKRYHGTSNPCSFYFRPSLSGVQDRDEAGAPVVSEFLLSEHPDGWTSLWKLRDDEKNGLIFWSGLTPTDIRVASGKLQFGTEGAAKLGLAVFARYAGMVESLFQQAIEEEIQRKLCMEAISFVNETAEEALDWLEHYWFQKWVPSQAGIGLDIELKLTVPVVGAGAPAAAYLPNAFQRFHTECILPEPFSVACAVGAVVGMVNITLTGEIRSADSGRYSLHTPAGRELFQSLQEALHRGRIVLEGLAREQMLQNHVVEPIFDFTTEEKKVVAATGEEIYLATILRLQATGRPNVWKQERKLD